MEDEPCSSSTAPSSARNGQAAGDIKNGGCSADGGSIDDGIVLAGGGSTTIVEEDLTEDDECGKEPCASSKKQKCSRALISDVELEDGLRRAEETAASTVE